MLISKFRSLFLFGVVALVMPACVPVVWSQETGSKDLPNVVVFLVDDLGFMDIGANNPDAFYETPNIDSLAQSGMRFTDGYAANPVCSPTRYSLMTGKYPTRVQATNFFSGKKSGRFNPAPLNDRMPLNEVTIAQALKGRGYATFFAGKWHLGDSEEYYPQNRGFDVNIGGYSKGGPYSGKKYFGPFQNPQMKVESPAGDHLPDRLARDTAGFIREHADKPFLAYLAFYSVHTPLMGRPDLVQKYKQKAASINGEEFADEEQVLGNQPRRVRILQKHAVYAAMVEAMDQAVGKVLRQLEQSGVADNTVVVFTSDNGGLSTSEGSPTSNLPLRGGKGWVYEGGIREPWIVRYPGVTKPGTESAEPICSIDLFPTLAAAAGVKVDHLVDGIDLRPALQGGHLDDRALYWHYPHYSNQGGIPGGAIREGDFKLFERYEDGRVHLYNLKQDIGERQDLAADMPDRVNRMRQRLHTWYQTVDAKFLQEKDGRIPWQPETATKRTVAAQQSDWYDKYKKQDNIPLPEDMLLNTDPEPDITVGFRPLFNGKDLTGWTPKGGSSTFDVRDGVLVGECVPGTPSTYLCTDNVGFRDFIFTCDMKWDVNTNSGVMFRAQVKPGKDSETVFGPQAEMEGITGDRGWSGGIYGQSCGGYFYPLWLEDHKRVRGALKKTDWNRLTIKAVDNEVKTWLNGVPAAHWVDDGSYPEGFFGLQIHKGQAGRVLWKDIRVRELNQ